MRVRVLGSAAGGGFPQWNCGCPGCTLARTKPHRAKPRTQEQVAVSNDGDTWFLLNASPDIRMQIESFPALHPRGPRHSPIAGVVLTNGDLDHCLGLFTMREWQPFRVYATRAVYEGLMRTNSIARTLERFDGQLRSVELTFGARVPLVNADGESSGLTVQAIPCPGKLPIHLMGLREPSPEDSIGVIVHEECSGKTLAFLSGVKTLTPEVERAVDASDLCFFDGTFWSSNELSSLGLGDKTAEDMGHWPVGGDGGSLKWLSSHKARRAVLIHINNTNPILVEDSSEASSVRQAGVTIAYDGMELEV